MTQQQNGASANQRHVVDIEDPIGDSIDLLGASVVRLKQNQEVEGKEAVDEIEARYIALRHDYLAWKERTAAAARANPQDAPGRPGAASKSEQERRDLEKVREQARQAISAAQSQLISSYQNIRSYLTDQKTQTALRRNAEELQANIANIIERMNVTLNRTLRRRNEGDDDNHRSKK